MSYCVSIFTEALNDFASVDLSKTVLHFGHVLHQDEARLESFTVIQKGFDELISWIIKVTSSSWHILGKALARRSANDEVYIARPNAKRLHQVFRRSLRHVEEQALRRGEIMRERAYVRRFNVHSGNHFQPGGA